MMILVDSNGLAYRSKYTMQNLTYADRSVGIIYGFLYQILTIADLLEANKFVFAWDSRKSLRSILYPYYRSKRKKLKMKRTFDQVKQDEIDRKQFVELYKEVLPDMGFRNVFRQTGYEADDLVAKLAEESKEETVIVSSDHDLHQCLKGNVVIYNPATKKIFRDSDFKRLWGINAYMWKVVLSITGCGTDSVRGVPGVGEKRAIQFLKGEFQADHKVVQSINAYQKRIKRNTRLVELPFQGTMDFKVRSDRISEVKLTKVFNRFGFSSFLRDPLWSRWKRRFCNEEG